jgi:hypothetical protein
VLAYSPCSSQVDVCLLVQSAICFVNRDRSAVLLSQRPLAAVAVWPKGTPQGPPQNPADDAAGGAAVAGARPPAAPTRHAGHVQPGLFPAASLAGGLDPAPRARWLIPDHRGSVLLVLPCTWCCPLHNLHFTQRSACVHGVLVREHRTCPGMPGMSSGMSAAAPLPG